MKKLVILWILVLSVAMTLQVSAQFSVDTVPLYDSEEIVTFIVEMEGRPVLPEMKLSEVNKGAKNGDAQAYRGTLVRSHKAATDAISSELSDDVKPQYTYTEIFNGFAIEAKYGDMEVIKNTEGVKNVYVSQKRKANFRMGNAPSMTHSLPSETLGYTGSGQVIAIIDSEFDVKHEAFATDPQNPKYTKADIEDILSSTEFNASGDANRVYESEKIPFRFDYGEGDAETYASVGLHGTHVAGIAAGNSPDGEFRGVATDAQLILMKVSDANGYMKEAAIIAAMDDAAKFGVCAINCSFGDDYAALADLSPAFVTCFENAYNAGIFVSSSAGNVGRGFYSMPSETIHVDDSATGTPNAMDNIFSIASVENSVVRVPVSEITLGDGSVLECAPFYENAKTFPTGEYVYCALGYPEDFEGVDVNGKIALLDRGQISFVIKADNAKAAGASGIIVVNTAEDYVSTQELSLPAVCVKASFGSLLKNAEDKTISSIGTFVMQPFEKKMEISSFSSYGTTEYLGLKPDTSAPGGNIYSSWPNDEYGYASGTSMAAPHMSGVVAIVNQYLEDTGCTATLADRADLIGNMLMSSADVVYTVSDDEENKVPVSPRVQGAGLANTANAIKTPVILYADNGKTKIELGDNLTDTVEFSFTAQNLTENDVVYDKISTVTLTDGYVTENGKNYISGVRLLKSELITDFDTVTVPANASVQLSVKIQLDADELNENLSIFQNGFHIDGFIRLENTTEDIVAVGMPFMGFFGNWTQAPIFDTTVYDEGGSSLIYEPQGHLGTFLYTINGEQTLMLGSYSESGTKDANAIAISPDGDGYYDALGLQLATMRSIRDLKVILADENGNALDTTELGTVSKYKKIAGMFGLPENIPDGQYFVRLEGYMNYDSENSVKHTLSIPFKVDRQKPLVRECKLEGNALTLDICDTSGVRYLCVVDTVTDAIYDGYFDSYIEEEKLTCVFSEEATDRELSNIRVYITDSAMNISSYFLGGFGGEIGANVSEISADEESYSITFELIGEDEFSDASLMLAFYDADGILMHTDVMRNQTVSAGEYVFTGEFDASTADKCKLFIWQGTETLKPLDIVKIFDMKMYEISNENK